LTIIGVIINRFRPDAMQRARLDVIDKPLRVIKALPGTPQWPGHPGRAGALPRQVGGCPQCPRIRAGHRLFPRLCADNGSSLFEVGDGDFLVVLSCGKPTRAVGAWVRRTGSGAAVFRG
jgi:hypothetical protein